MRDRDWLKENWKWFIPTLISSVLFLVIASVAIGFIYVAGVVKTSPIYKMSLKKAKENAHVQKTFGTPLKGGMFISGTISVSHLSGAADFAIPIKGPKSEGSLRVQAQKVDDEWIYSVLEVDIKNSSESIDLLPKEQK